MISIVTPAFNAAAHLPRTLEAMSTQEATLEHIVADAGSNDGTRAIIEKWAQRYPVSMFSEPDEGLYDGVQKGFAKARGDIFGWLNAGDAYLPWTLRVVERVFNEFPAVQWITGIPCLYIESERLFCGSPFIPVYTAALIRRGWHNGKRLAVLQQESMFWRRSLWERSRGAEILKGKGKRSGLASDFHLWKRFAEHAEIHTVCSPISAFSVMEGQISQRHREAYFADMGVTQPPYIPSRWMMRLFRLYSAFRLGRCIHLDLLPRRGQKQ